MKAFFRRNPTPARVEDNNDEEEIEKLQIPMHSTTANQVPPAAPAPIAAPPAAPAPAANPPTEFFAQLIETMKNIQAPQHPAKIVVKSRDHKESVDLAKLQNGMLQLMYTTGGIIWDDSIVKNTRVASFSQGFLNYDLARLASVQATQLSNLFMTIFSTEPKDNQDESQINPLNRLMSLAVFPPKFTKGHLNASFQSLDLKAALIYKSTSIHPFHYALQNNRKLIIDAANKMDEEQNKINWRIVKKDRSKIASMIEGVGHINSMEDVAMTCANICSVQLAMVIVLAGKPLLYQCAGKVICFIENKKTKTWLRDNLNSIAHLPMVFMAKIHQFFQHLALFLQNSINTNKIELCNDKFDTKYISIAVRLASKFFNKMQEHVEDNSIPKDVPAFAKGFFLKAPGGGYVPALKDDEAKKSGTAQPADGNSGGKRRPNGKEQQGQKKPRKEFSDKSLKMSLFHIKKGTPASKHCPIRAL
jgi:hypothetical protein